MACKYGLTERSVSSQHDYNVRNKASLLTEIQRQTRKGGGLSVRTLKESWKEAPQAIEELEKEGEVYVTRTLKDGQLRMVFWNEIKPDDEAGGAPVEKGASNALWSTVMLTASRILGSLALTSSAQRCRPAEAARKRGPPGHSRGDTRAQGARGQEEGEEEWPEAPPNPPHKHSFERPDRFIEGLCRTREVVKHGHGLLDTVWFHVL